MPKPPAVVTVDRVNKVLNWVIKYLKIVKGRVGGPTAASARMQRRLPIPLLPWGVDCAAPQRRGEVDVVNALDACIASLEDLKGSFGHLPKRHPLA